MIYDLEIFFIRLSRIEKEKWYYPTKYLYITINICTFFYWRRSRFSPDFQETFLKVSTLIMKNFWKEFFKIVVILMRREKNVPILKHPCKKHPLEYFTEKIINVVYITTKKKSLSLHHSSSRLKYSFFTASNPTVDKTCHTLLFQWKLHTRIHLNWYSTKTWHYLYNNVYILWESCTRAINLIFRAY